MAGVRLLSAVRAEVLLQAGFLGGSVRAQLAGKGFLPGVRPAVSLVFPLGGERLVAVRAFEVLGVGGQQVRSPATVLDLPGHRPDPMPTPLAL